MRHGLSLVALCVVIGPAAAADMPPRKPGLWELQINYTPNSPAQTIKQCVDAETDKMMQTTSGRVGQETCSKRDVSTSGDKTIVDAVCAIAGKTYTSQTTITGSLNSAYTMKIASKTDGAAGKPTEINIAMDGKWLGPCSGDLVAGDVVLPNGKKMNVRTMPNTPGQSAPSRAQQR